jgi:DNA-binding CsgD family transcriptional regulator
MSKDAPHTAVRARKKQRQSRAPSASRLPTASARLDLSALQDMPLPCEVLMVHLFNLTPAEARLARCISTGDAVEKAAATLKIKLSTARTQLSALFAKTSTRRQSQLVGLLVRVAHLGNRKAPIG